MAGLCPYLPHSPQKVRNEPSVVARFHRQLCARTGWHCSGRSCHPPCTGQCPPSSWQGCSCSSGPPSCPTAHPVPREPFSCPVNSSTVWQCLLGASASFHTTEGMGCQQSSPQSSPGAGLECAQQHQCPKHARRTMAVFCLATLLPQRQR